MISNVAKYLSLIGTKIQMCYPTNKDCMIIALLFSALIFAIFQLKCVLWVFIRMADDCLESVFHGKCP